ncbi:Abortive infection bacteriophage resistance protein [Aromatoleum tolulyticum]|uniref:Abortive infection bacteriophage resistance protein n=1 Tax=Aromatoleum tolulyticum TaxID=34027 RepID=A0A1N6N6K6_9RHOO|nr:Abi family protein [Aromatoleum tolulyticum]SIP87675.1 Abortive infection bacteriophage resistance protein [Aromatoleum tolulyticum]
MAFSKPALTVDGQIDLLVQRGVAIADRPRARHYLTHINYYRLRAYWLPFETAPDNGDAHAFVAGTDFETVLAIYVFDRELRLLLLDAIERIEISLRTTLAQTLALRYGPFAQDEAARFKDRGDWQRSQEELRKEYQRSRETFAKHYRERYPELASPPIWVACELMTLGHLSRWLKNLAKPEDRQHIADQYGLDERVLISFAHHLTVVRNHCAHHGRVWNRRFALRFTLPTKKPRHIASDFNPGEPQLIYNTLTMLAYLLDLLSPAHHWRREIHQLLAAHPEIDPAAMGFPDHWRETRLWREVE